MYDLAENLTVILGFFTFLGHLGLVLLFALYLMRKTSNPLFKLISTHILWLGFLLSLIATGMSLFYSEIAGYAPCLLCWWQRIFIYPQVILYGMALWKKDRGVLPYTITLSIIGLLIAIYHYISQMVEFYLPENTLSLDCGVEVDGVSCTSFYFLEFGYITMPMMSVTALIFLVLMPLIAKKK